MKVTKAVIPVAGLGTRMLPATKAIPKEMLPIVDKPLIQYVVEECVAAGIKEIVLVTHSSKSAIEDHFDTNYELEAALEQKGKTELLEAVRSIRPADVTIMSVRQGQAMGLGHAILCARPLVGDEPFAVVLPDVLIDDVASDLSRDNLAEMARLYESEGVSQVMVEPVPQEQVSSYGVVDINSADLQPGDGAPIHAVVEKPPIDQAPSNLAVVGRYILSSNIWPILAQTPPGAGSEIQLTDAIATLMQDEPVSAFHIIGKSHDCGSKLGYMKAFVEYGVRDVCVGRAFKGSL